MYSDSLSIIRVVSYFKRQKGVDPVTRLPFTYRTELDWGIGVVDDGYNGVHTIGGPYQLFSNGSGGIWGDATVDSRVQIIDQEMPFSTLQGEDPIDVNLGLLHFKHPNI